MLVIYVQIRQDWIIKCDLKVGIVTTIGLPLVSSAWKKQNYIVIANLFVNDQLLNSKSKHIEMQDHYV